MTNNTLFFMRPPVPAQIRNDRKLSSTLPNIAWECYTRVIEYSQGVSNSSTNAFRRCGYICVSSKRLAVQSVSSKLGTGASSVFPRAPSNWIDPSLILLQVRHYWLSSSIVLGGSARLLSLHLGFRVDDWNRNLLSSDVSGHYTISNQYCVSWNEFRRTAI